MEKEIALLKSGERYIVPEGDYGKAEVWRINGVFVLFEIPMYGGNPIYNGTHYSLTTLITEINKWT